MNLTQYLTTGPRGERIDRYDGTHDETMFLGIYTNGIQNSFDEI